MIAAPAKQPCKDCTSLECGQHRCRFDDPHEFKNKEVDERLEELREFDRHPERYR